MKHRVCHLDYVLPHVMLLSLNTIGVSQLLVDEMEQWNERTQLLEAKLDEVRKKPGNSLTGNVKLALKTCINKPCKKANLDFFFFGKNVWYSHSYRTLMVITRHLMDVKRRQTLIIAFATIFSSSNTFMKETEIL